MSSERETEFAQFPVDSVVDIHCSYIHMGK
jgi:hypothetical protein